MKSTMKRVMVVAGLAVAAACSNPNGPNPGTDRFDAKKVTDGVAAIERVAGNPVLASFKSLGGQIPAAVGGVGATGPDRLIGVVRDLATMVSIPTGPSAIPVIRPTSLGKTMVYDAAAGKYVISDRTGAPSNGVRFVLYRNDASNRPDPVQEIGFADLTDEKAAAANAAGLRLKVVSDGKTYLDYSFDLSGSIGSATVNVKGFLSDGVDRVEFELTTNGQLFGRGGTVTLDAKIAVPSQQFSIDARVVGKAGQSEGTGQFDLTIKAGSDIVAVSARGSETEVDATVTVNGKLLASIKGSPTNPVIKGEGGRELTADELAALGAVYHFAEGVFQLIAGLLAPAGVLLLLGLGL